MDELERLYDEGNRIRLRISEIEEDRRDAENTKLLGRCFRYRNSYGSEERWWLYAKVIGLRDGNLVCHRFQTMSDGRMEVELEYEQFHSLSDGYEEISCDEFTAEWTAFKAKITDHA